MVFVLGILALLALVGLILLTRTHGESKRVSMQSTASAQDGVRDGVINKVRETLRMDIWGPPGTPPTALPLSHQVVSGIQETNEPHDFPGPSDRWLHSSMPYYVGDLEVNDPPESESDVLAWTHVSYLGTDAFQVSNPFRWGFDSRTGLLAPALPYGETALSNVEIIQTPPPLANFPAAFDESGLPLPMIPGSTTNVTIASSRRVHVPANPGERFPYFDTNADGELDLYDADGDGIPDSPISFVRKIRSIAYPTSPARTSERGIDNQRLSPACIVVNQTMNPPMITSSPCAKLNTLLAR